MILTYFLSCVLSSLIWSFLEDSIFLMLAYWAVSENFF